LGGFRRLREEVVYSGPLITVAKGWFLSPEGTEFERDVVHHPGAVSVVPIVDQGEGAILVRQYRSAVDTELLEIPAGKRDVVGEAPETTARRELEEEVGMRAARMEKLAEFYNTPGFCDERHWVFMALDLEACEQSAQGVEEQHMSVERISLDDVPDLMANGTIMDAKTIIGLTLARQALL
jgi:ADP-ribose pyrophosphatase